MDRIAWLTELGLRQRGIFRGTQCLEHFSWRELDTLVQQGWIERVGRDLYRFTQHPQTWYSELQRGLFESGPAGVVALRAAGRLHHMWRYRNSEAVEVLRLHAGDHDVAAGRLRRSTLLPESHITVVDGFPVTTVARTWFDLCGDPDAPLRHSEAGRLIHAQRMRRVLDDALAHRGLTLAAAASVVATLAGRGRPGTRVARALIRDLAPHYVPTESEGEALFVELAEAFDLPTPERQVHMSDGQGFIGRVDFLYRRRRVVVEIDGPDHDAPLARIADAERDARLGLIGYVVIRIRYADLIADPQRQLRRVREALTFVDPNLGGLSRPGG